MGSIEEILKKNNGYLASKELTKGSQYYRLKAMQEKGIVSKIKKGMYRHNSMVNYSEGAEIMKIVPNGILCLYSAWHYHQLSTQIPDRYHVAIPQKRKVKLPDYPFMRLTSRFIVVVTNNKHELPACFQQAFSNSVADTP